jgi:hypothetical protein
MHLRGTGGIRFANPPYAYLMASTLGASAKVGSLFHEGEHPNPFARYFPPDQVHERLSRSTLARGARKHRPAHHIDAPVWYV